MSDAGWRGVPKLWMFLKFPKTSGFHESFYLFLKFSTCLYLLVGMDASLMATGVFILIPTYLPNIKI